MIILYIILWIIILVGGIGPIITHYKYSKEPEIYPSDELLRNCKPIWDDFGDDDYRDTDDY